MATIDSASRPAASRRVGLGVVVAEFNIERPERLALKERRSTRPGDADRLEYEDAAALAEAFGVGNVRESAEIAEDRSGR